MDLVIISIKAYFLWGLILFLLAASIELCAKKETRMPFRELFSLTLRITTAGTIVAIIGLAVAWMLFVRL